MSMYLRVEALDGTGVTLIDEAAGTTPLDPVVQTGTDWGNAQWEAAFSGPRGTLGRTGLQTQVSDREVTLVVRFYGSTMDDLASRIAAYARVVDEVRRQGGGRIIRRVHTSAVKATLQITATRGVSTGAWTARSETVPRRDVTAAFTCAPFWEGEPMDMDLSLATGADPTMWAYQPPSPPGTFTVTSTGLQRTGSNAVVRLLPATYKTADHQVTATFVAGGNSGQVYGCVGRWINSTNYVQGSLSGTTLTVVGVVANSTVVSATASVTAPTAGQVIAIRLTVHSDGARVDYFADGVNGVADAAAPTATAVTPYSSPPVGNFGVAGSPGVVFNSNNQTDQARIASVKIRPYTVDYTGQVPAVVPVRGIPGDAPALGDLQVTANQGFEFGLLGWRDPGTRVVNHIDVVTARLNDTLGWYPTAGSTAAKMTTGGRTGTDFVRVTFTSTNPSGIQTNGYVFPAGWKWPARQRTFECWVRSASSTAPCQLSVNGVTTTVTLSTSWQRLAVTFIPNPAGGAITLAIQKTGTSTGSFDVDDIALYDGPVAAIPAGASPAAFGVLQAANFATDDSGPVAIYQDPSFLVDGGDGGGLVECWGRVGVHSSVTSANAVLRVRHESGVGDPQYALETGISGRPITVPGKSTTKLVRLGTLRLPAGRCRIEPRFTFTGTSTTSSTVHGTSPAAVAGYSQWTSPGNAAAIDGAYVSAAGTVTVANDWTTNLSIASGNSIQRIDVQAWQPSGGANCPVQVYLSTDNFATTVQKTLVLEANNPSFSTTYAVGDPLWGREWAPADFATLKVRLIATPPSSIQFDRLTVVVTYATSGPDMESIIIVPADNRAVTPTGVQSTGWAKYPGAEYRKTVRADLSSRTDLTSTEASGYQVTPGMGGSLIELPPGDVETIVKLSPTVPDSPDVLNSADPVTTTNTAVHIAVTPRWAILREPV